MDFKMLNILSFSRSDAAYITGQPSFTPHQRDQCNVLMARRGRCGKARTGTDDSHAGFAVDSRDNSESIQEME